MGETIFGDFVDHQVEDKDTCPDCEGTGCSCWQDEMNDRVSAGNLDPCCVKCDGTGYVPKSINLQGYRRGIGGQVKREDVESELVASLVGRTIVATVYDDGGRGRWDCDESVTLTFDDGRVVRFGGYGLHTDGGVTIDVLKP